MLLLQWSLDACVTKGFGAALISKLNCRIHAGGTTPSTPGSSSLQRTPVKGGGAAAGAIGEDLFEMQIQDAYNPDEEPPPQQHEQLPDPDQAGQQEAEEAHAEPDQLAPDDEMPSEALLHEMAEAEDLPIEECAPPCASVLHIGHRA